MKRLGLLVMLVGILGGNVTVWGDDLFWCEGGWGPGQLRCADLNDLSHPSVLFSDSQNYMSLIANAEKNTLYWTGYGKIQRAVIGVVTPEVLVTGAYYYSDIYLDEAGGKMYWSCSNTLYPTTVGMIQRANLDGSEVETLLSYAHGIRGLAVDTTQQKIYWTMRQNETSHTGWAICRADMNGYGMESLVVGEEIEDIALDYANGKMYWTDWVGRTVGRSNLDGTATETIYAGTKCPMNLYLDGQSKLYWTEWDGYGSNQGDVWRSNPDGSNAELLFNTTNRPMGITLVPEPMSLSLLALGGVLMARRRN